MKTQHFVLLCLVFIAFSFFDISYSFAATRPISIIPIHAFYTRDSSSDDETLTYTFKLINHLKHTVKIKPILYSGALPKLKLTETGNNSCHGSVKPGSTGCTVTYIDEKIPGLTNSNVTQTFYASFTITDNLGFHYPVQNFGLLVKPDTTNHVEVGPSDLSDTSNHLVESDGYYSEINVAGIATLKSFNFTAKNKNNFAIRIKTRYVKKGKTDNLKGKLNDHCDGEIAAQSECTFSFKVNSQELPKNITKKTTLSAYFETRNADNHDFYSRQIVKLTILPIVSDDLVVTPATKLKKEITAGDKSKFTFEFIATNVCSFPIKIKTPFNKDGGDFITSIKSHCSGDPVGGADTVTVKAGKYCQITVTGQSSDTSKGESAKTISQSFKVENADNTSVVYETSELTLKILPHTNTDLVITPMGELKQKVEVGTETFKYFKFKLLNTSTYDMNLLAQVTSISTSTVDPKGEIDTNTTTCTGDFSKNSAGILASGTSCDFIYKVSVPKILIKPDPPESYKDLTVSKSIQFINKTSKVNYGENECKPQEIKLTVTPHPDTGLVITQLDNFKKEINGKAGKTTIPFKLKVKNITQYLIDELDIKQENIGKNIIVDDFPITGDSVQCQDNAIAPNETCKITFMVPVPPANEHATGKETFVKEISIWNKKHNVNYGTKRIELTVVHAAGEDIIVTHENATRTIKEGASTSELFTFDLVNTRNNKISLMCPQEKEISSKLKHTDLADDAVNVKDCDGDIAGKKNEKNEKPFTVTVTVPNLTTPGKSETFSKKIVIQDKNGDYIYDAVTVSLTVIPQDNNDLIIIPLGNQERTIKKGASSSEEFKFEAINKSDVDITLKCDDATGAEGSVLELAKGKVTNDCSDIEVSAKGTAKDRRTITFTVDTSGLLPDKNTSYSRKIKFSNKLNKIIYDAAQEVTLTVIVPSQADFAVDPLYSDAQTKIKVGTTPTPLSFTVTNNSSSVISNLGLSSFTGGLQGTVDTSNCKTIEKQGSCDFTFTPDSKMLKTVKEYKGHIVIKDSSNNIKYINQEVTLTVGARAKTDFIIVPIEGGLFRKVRMSQYKPMEFKFQATNNTTSTIGIQAVKQTTASSTLLGNITSLTGCDTISPGKSCTITFTTASLTDKPPITSDTTFSTKLNFKSASADAIYYYDSKTLHLKVISEKEDLTIFPVMVNQKISKASTVASLQPFTFKAVNNSSVDIELVGKMGDANIALTSASGCTAVDKSSNNSAGVVIGARQSCDIKYQPTTAPIAGTSEIKFIKKNVPAIVYGTQTITETLISSTQGDIVVTPVDPTFKKINAVAIHATNGDTQTFKFKAVNTSDVSIKLALAVAQTPTNDIVTGCAAAVAPGGSCDITYTLSVDKSLKTLTVPKTVNASFTVKDANALTKLFSTQTMQLTVLPLKKNSITIVDSGNLIQTVKIGDSFEPITFTVVNQGGSVISNLKLIKNNIEYQSDQDSVCSTIELGQTCVFTYTPDLTTDTASGLTTISIKFKDDDGTEYTLPDGKQVKLTVVAHNKYEFVVDPVTPLEKEIGVGGNAQDVTFEFKVVNKSNAAINTVSLDAKTHASTHTLLNGSVEVTNCSTPLQPLGECTVKFTPNDLPITPSMNTTTLNNTITVKLDDLESYTQDVKLKVIDSLSVTSLGSLSREIQQLEGKTAGVEEFNFKVVNNTNTGITPTITLKDVADASGTEMLPPLDGVINRASSNGCKLATVIAPADTCIFTFLATVPSEALTNKTTLAKNVVINGQTKRVEIVVTPLQKLLAVYPLSPLSQIIITHNFPSYGASNPAQDVHFLFNIISISPQLPPAAPTSFKVVMESNSGHGHLPIKDNTTSQTVGGCTKNGSSNYEIKQQTTCIIDINLRLNNFWDQGNKQNANIDFKKRIQTLQAILKLQDATSNKIYYYQQPLSLTIINHNAKNSLPLNKSLVIASNGNLSQQINRGNNRLKNFTFNATNTSHAIIRLKEQMLTDTQSLPGRVKMAACKKGINPGKSCTITFMPLMPQLHTRNDAERFAASFKIKNADNGVVYSTEKVHLSVMPKSDKTNTLPIYNHFAPMSEVPANIQEVETGKTNPKRTIHKNHHSIVNSQHRWMFKKFFIDPKKNIIK